MTGLTRQSRHSSVWALVRSQYGAISHEQLAARDYSNHAIQHRLDTGRLHQVHRGVYAVGRPELTQKGRWMAAVQACGEGAVLSHESAAALWEIGKAPRKNADIHISIPFGSGRSHDGIVIHRRSALTATDLTTHQNIPMTTPTATLIDLAATTNERRLERDQRSMQPRPHRPRLISRRR